MTAFDGWTLQSSIRQFDLLPRHWSQRSPAATTCTFCGDGDDSMTQFDLASVGLDGRVTSRGTYLLRPSRVDVFETFVRDVRADALPPDA
ncbi:MAG: hypothetical protein ABEJ78_12660 [Haloferacaceae archaeon]